MITQNSISTSHDTSFRWVARALAISWSQHLAMVSSGPQRTLEEANAVTKFIEQVKNNC